MEKLGFGKKLIEVRKAKGLTQEEVAEDCKITVRTIQRIESGVVMPRASTIKIISETLGFDFFYTSNTGYDGSTEDQNSNLKNHNVLWYLKDLFNLKTNSMKKISILSVSFLLIGLLFVQIIETKAQSITKNSNNCLFVKFNADNSVNRIEAVFTNNLTLDSLIRVKNELLTYGITVSYKKLEFDTQDKLAKIYCDVNSNDGFGGSFGTDMLYIDKTKRIGFVRDYSKKAKNPFCTGACGL
ncbi:MAG TPA: helix-turn-helix domain-containing protein [Saprospiraceae bacterium]|nr:helix-turn-helix domain-containing protein [Saprospiraceae bacterium]